MSQTEAKILDKQILQHLKQLSSESMLRELLCTIHSDGGHHIERVGLPQAVLDAQNKISNSKHILSHLREAVEEKLDSYAPEPIRSFDDANSLIEKLDRREVGEINAYLKVLALIDNLEE